MMRLFSFMVVLVTGVLLYHGYRQALWTRHQVVASLDCCQTEQSLRDALVSTDTKKVDFAVPLITSKEKSLFNEELWPEKRTRKLADDINLRKTKFLEKSVGCSQRGMSKNSSQSIAQSCALKLRVPEVALASLDFALLNTRLLQEVTRPRRRRPQHNGGRMKNILFWVEKKVPKYTFGRQVFLEAKCPVDTCQMTADRRRVPPDQVDAVVLHSFLMLRARSRVLPPSKLKYPNAKIILLTGEAPIRHPDRFHTLNGVVDYTMGYRRDSDIVRTLALTLRHHGVRVDVFGECGDHSCDVTNASYCYEMLQRDYKFYFSFENSLCNHYVTEKFYNILNYNVVPVTFGFGHELTGAPADAYIDAFDFPNAKALADHLLYLDSNVTAYMEYFRWKQYYGVYLNFGPDDAFCKLCETLVRGTRPLRPYPDMRAWLAEGQCVDALHDSEMRAFIYGTQPPPQS